MHLELLRSDAFFIAISIIAIVATIFATHNKTTKAASYITHIIIALLIYVVIIGLRPESAGNDTAAYINTYKAIQGLSSAWGTGASYYGSQDILFWPIAGLLKTLGISADNFILAITSLSSLLLFLSISKISKIYEPSQAITPVFFILIAQSYAIVYFGNHVRSFLAVPFLILSIHSLLQRKNTAALIFCMIASGIHSSNIAFLPLIALSIVIQSREIAVTRTKIIIMLSLAIAASTSQELIFDTLFSQSNAYLQSKIESYSTKTYEIESVYTSATFWILSLSTAAMLFSKPSNNHLPYYYTFALILALSSTPKVAERFFVHALILLPILLHYNIKQVISPRKTIILISALYLIIGCLAITRPSTIFTLSLRSII